MKNKLSLSTEPLLLRVEQAAALCGLATSTVYQLMSAGQFCPSLKLGKSRLFRMDLLRKWCELNCPPIDKFEILCKEAKK